MAFPDSFLDALVARSDITDVVSRYVSLTKKGGNLFGLCPFHTEKTPSFSVSPDKQFYHCFGCGKGGGVISFIMEIERLTYPEAVRFLAEKAGLEIPEEGADSELPRQRKRLLQLNREAAHWFYAQLSEPAGEKAAAYLEKRQLTKRTVTRFGLGAAPDSWDGLIRAMGAKGFSVDELLLAGLAVRGGKSGSVYDKFRDRLIFPVMDVRGEVLGFSGRALNDGQEPKYLNTQETLVFSKRQTLFGINLAKNTKRDQLLLVEGNVDVVMLHQAGFDHAVASLGTSLTQEQIRLMARYAKELVICYDNDPAGHKATERALELTKNSELNVRVLRLPDRIVDGKAVKIDADDFIKLRGAEAFEQLLKGSGGGMEYRLNELQSRFDLSVDEQRIDYLKEACTLLAGLDSAVSREVWCRRAAEPAGISTEALMREVEKARVKRIRGEKKQEERENARPAGLAQPKERQLRYENVRSGIAEEGVLRLLLTDPEKIASCPLSPEEFTSPVLGKMYRSLRERAEGGLSVTPGALLAGLSEGEAQLLTALLQKPESGGAVQQALADYVHVIRQEQIYKSGDLEAIARLKRN